MTRPAPVPKREPVPAIKARNLACACHGERVYRIADAPIPCQRCASAKRKA